MIKMNASSALKSQFLVYEYIPTLNAQFDLLSAIDEVENVILFQLQHLWQKHKALKFQLKVHLLFSKYDFVLGHKVEIDAWFSTENVLILTKNQIEDNLTKAWQKIFSKLDTFVKEGSGWVLANVLKIVLKVAKFRIIKGGCSDSCLPKELKKSKAIVKCERKSKKMCFLHTIILSLNLDKKKRNRSRIIKSDLKCLKHLPLKMLKFPTSLKDVLRFEKFADFCINIYGFENACLFPYYVSSYSEIRPKQVDILYHQEHFYPIQNLALLLKQGQSKRNTRKSFVCRHCLSVFSKKTILDFHETLCPQEAQHYKMPATKEFIKFDSFRCMVPHVFVVYADFETSMGEKQFKDCKGKQISKVFHEPLSFAALTVCRDNSKFNQAPTVYTGGNCIKRFFLHLQEEYFRTQEILDSVHYPLVMSKEEQEIFQATTHCQMCDISFELIARRDKVRDHNHLNGDYRAALCHRCNLRYAVPSRKLVVIFHGLSNYDSHFLIQELHNYDSNKIKIIPRSSEKYLTFSLENIQFKDSYLFLSDSLSNLADNLRSKSELCFNFLQTYVPDNSLRNMLYSKGFFPYSYVKGLATLEETKVPPPSAFYNDLSDTPIKDKDYEFVHKVWKSFHCKNLKDYLEVYLLTDVLLLTDVFENFRTNCLRDYKLDPVHYLSGAHFTFNAFLLFSDVSLELMMDINQYLLFRKMIRGGLSMVSKRYALAENKYIDPDCNLLKPSYQLYLDANNLYGWAMLQPLPCADFEWKSVTKENLQNVLLDKFMGKKGYILEVDLEYPDNLHTAHNDFPVAPEKQNISYQELSPTAKQLCDTQSSKASLNAVKLLATLKNKNKYVLYYKNLIFYLSLGLKLKKVYKILEFTQKPFMKSYVDFNSNKRALAKNNFDVNFYKFLSNSLFGKTMERPENKSQVKLVNNIEAYENYVSKLNFKEAKILNPNLVSLELKYPSFTVSKPFYIGAVILELAKLHMYQFHYTVMKRYFGERLQLLYTDTDSLLYEIQSTDVYRELEQIQNTSDKPIFDFSNYDQNHFLHSNEYKRVPGLFKDECAGKPVAEFVGLRSKMYALRTTDTQTSVKHAKGVKMSVIKELAFDDFKNCLFNETSMEHQFKTIRSERHKVFTSHQSKKSLSSFDDKRWLRDNISSYAYGHFAEKTS